ncbi:MAG: Rossmann-like and DUF2520 domain-containing protein [Niabella sp.]
MNIVILGSGNVAASLGRKFLTAQHQILQVYGRNTVTGNLLAKEWGTEYCNNLKQINRNADIYILAIADNAIEEITKNLQLPGKLIAHTAAAVPMDVLKTVSERYGVIYPLQSLRKEVVTTDIPFYIEAVNNASLQILKELAQSISTLPVLIADYKTRIKLHIAAVMVNNFTNHIFVMAENFCNKENIDFKMLLPLIQNTANRVATTSPSLLQTGPAVRGDVNSITIHEEMLEQYPAMLKLYKCISDSIRQCN